MPNLKPGDEITIRVKVTAVWPNGEVTVQLSNGNRETIKADSPSIVDAPKPGKARKLFDEDGN